MNYKKLFKFSLLSLGLLYTNHLVRGAQNPVLEAMERPAQNPVLEAMERAVAQGIDTISTLQTTANQSTRAIQDSTELATRKMDEKVASTTEQLDKLQRATQSSIATARDTMERTIQEAQRNFDSTTIEAERKMSAAVSKATGDMDKTAREATGRIQTTALDAQSSIDRKKSEATTAIDYKTTEAERKIATQATTSERKMQETQRSAEDAIERAQRELTTKEATINNNVAAAQRALDTTARTAEENINKAEARTTRQLTEQLDRAKAQAEAIYKASVEECQKQASLTRNAANEAKQSLTATQTEKTKAEEAARKAAESVRDVTRTFNEKITALDTKHAEEIRKLNETLAAKKRELDQALRDSQTRLDTALAENEARLNAERTNLTTTLDAERVQLTTHLRNEREAYDRRAQATIQHFDKTLDTAKESLVAEREVYLDAVKQEQQNSEARLAEEQEQQKRFLDLLNKQHLLELEETQARAIHEGMLSQVHAATMIQDLTRLGKLQTHQEKLILSTKAEEQLEATRHQNNQEIATFKIKGRKEVAQIDGKTQREVAAITAKAESERAKAQREAEARHNKEKLEAEERHNKEKLALEEKVKAHEREQAHKQKLLDIEKEGRLHAEKLAAERALKILDNEATAQRLKDKLQFGKESISSIGTGLVNLTNDQKRMLRIAGSVGCGATLIYAAKYGLPHLFAYLVQPRVVSETSKRSLFGWTAPSHEATLDELTFTPELQHILGDIALQLKTAREHGENLPNILFAGPPGTGKTAFAKALARLKSDKGELLFDYALTSGSEFAKIKDLNLATNELRKMIRWAQKSNKPMIIFIDEAESLFSDRTLPETPKSATDFINAFLSMVQDKSQKNICFIFATNHMFKLDSAIFNRVGKPIEFTLPGTTELAKILSTYVTKFAKANATSMVTIGKDFEVNYGSYAHELLGSVPRDIKFIAEQMIIKTRRTSNKILTDSIGRSAIKEAQRTLAMKESLEKNKATWMKQKTAITAQG